MAAAVPQAWLALRVRCQAGSRSPRVSSARGTTSNPSTNATAVYATGSIWLSFGWAFYRPDGLATFIVVLFFLGFFGGNFAIYRPQPTRNNANRTDPQNATFAGAPLKPDLGSNSVSAGLSTSA
jgi:hypothetical protein